MMEPDARSEEDAASRHGPSEVRERKTRAYVGRLCARWSESQVRRLLKVCAEPVDDASSMEHLLEQHDLDRDPLASIIRPYDWFGFSFNIRQSQSRKPGEYEIHFGSAADTCGCGGVFTAMLEADGTLKIVDRSWWIA